MSVPPDQMTPPAAQDPVAIAQGEASEAQSGLQSAISDFNPPQNNTPAFNAVAPQDHFQQIAGYAPIMAAFAAIGGAFSKQHGMTMLMSTNAMMKGMVQGSAEQYDDARKQYEQKYNTWVDQQRTWNDTYKAYLSAYKGRIDAQALAVKGANSAVGLAIKDKQDAQKDAQYNQNMVMQNQKMQATIEKNHEEFMHWERQDVSGRIRADSDAARAETAQQKVKLEEQKLMEDMKHQDANQLTATQRSLKEEADAVRKQYPLKDGKRDPEAQIKLTSIANRMEMVQDKLQEHQEADYNKNKATYDMARAKIARGGDPAAVKKTLADLGLDPSKL